VNPCRAGCAARCLDALTTTHSCGTHKHPVRAAIGTPTTTYGHDVGGGQTPTLTRITFRPPGSAGDANTIRIMEPTALAMSGLTSNFYPTLAQVLPVLLLALIWDSAYLTRLRRERRPLRRDDPAGVWFWTKPRVRVYILVVTGAAIMSIAIIMLVLTGLIPDSLGLRIALSTGLILLLATLAVRIGADVIRATSATPPPAENDQAAVRPDPADAADPAAKSQLRGDAPAT
jgi:hypothetical protein